MWWLISENEKKTTGSFNEWLPNFRKIQSIKTITIKLFKSIAVKPYCVMLCAIKSDIAGQIDTLF